MAENNAKVNTIEYRPINKTNAGSIININKLIKPPGAGFDPADLMGNSGKSVLTDRPKMINTDGKPFGGK